MKKIILFLFVLGAMVITECLACEYFPVFEAETSQLDLPCVNLGAPVCYKAKFDLEVEGDKAWLILSEFSETQNPVPQGEDGSYIPFFDYSNATLNLPFVALSSDMSTYEVTARLDTPVENEIALRVLNVAPKLLSNNLCSDGAKSACDLWDFDAVRHLMCYEYQGPALVVRLMTSKCEGIVQKNCPTEDAIASCSVSMPQQTITSYYYKDIAPGLQAFINGCNAGGGTLELLEE